MLPLLVERISIQNLLRASEIFLQEGDHYSLFEQALLQSMVSRVSAKVAHAKNLEHAI